MINAFPGYYYEIGEDTKLHNYYRDEDVGKGGYVYSEPGLYYDLAVLDISSMHPSSIIAMNCFGKYTDKFKELVDARIAIKKKDFKAAGKMFDGKLAPYLKDESQAKGLAYALKIVVNSVYGLTASNFNTPFRDVRNKNNIVALRGALFMVDLKHAIWGQGHKVVHIKTDSVKIPNATPDIIKFVMDFGKEYGYTFEHEATYSKMCLINDAVYIAYVKGDDEQEGYWSATGAQFQHPYVFKTLFTKEQIEFHDLAETKSVTSPGVIYLDMNEGLGEDEHNYVFVGRVGSFCPVREGTGGGLLMREKEGKYYAVTGTKGYRWKEKEVIEQNDWQDQVDMSYFDRLAEEARNAIGKFGDVDTFINYIDLLKQE